MPIAATGCKVNSLVVVAESVQAYFGSSKSFLFAGVNNFMAPVTTVLALIVNVSGGLDGSWRIWSRTVGRRLRLGFFLVVFVS